MDYNLFFALLRSGLYDIPVPREMLPDKIDWKPIMEFADKQVVIGLIIDSIHHLPEHLHPSASQTAKMNKFALGLIQANLVLDQSVAKLVRFFDRYDLPGVLLKGQGVSRYYRQPQLRHTGDIDFYVGPRLYKRAVTLCREHILHDPRGGDETDQHFTFMIGKVPVEIHRIASRIYSPVRNHRFQQWVTEELEQSPARRRLEVDGAAIMLPSYDFDAIFIFYHAWRHYIMGGIGLRQLCDLTMIFHSHGHEIDTRRLEENLRRFGMVKGWKLFAWIAVNRLGLPAEKMPLYDPTYSKRAQKVLDDIITGGNFGYYSKEIARTPIHGRGLWHALGKVRNVTDYSISLFPLMPVEATCLYFARLYDGLRATLRRKKNRE